MTFHHATTDDIPAITSLINRSYRGESSRAGWTTEADLLSGARIDETGLLSILNDPDSLIFITRSDETVLATIYAHHTNKCVHLGLFAVEPTIQGGGIGKRLLAYAEAESVKKWGVERAVMEVITARTELIAYYERRGFIRTGEKVPFPHSPLWDPISSDLELEILEKTFPD